MINVRAIMSLRELEHRRVVYSRRQMSKTIDYWRKGMKLATKVKLSFVIIIVFPILMISLFGISMSKHYVKIVEETYKIDMTEHNTGVLFDKASMMNLVMEQIRQEAIEMVYSADFKPDDISRWRDFQNENCAEYTYIATCYDEEFVYEGVSSNIVELLPEYDSVSDISVATYYVGNKTKYLVKPVAFTDGEADFGVVYIIGDVGKLLPEVRRFIIQFLLICVLLTVSLGAGLTLWIYGSILRPINKLKDAMNKMTDGNLDYELSYNNPEYYKDDEFGQLYVAYEDLRKHLKASIDKNIQNDIENKELISNISHDLKTPITAIKGYVEGIMDGVADTPEKMDKYIHTIYNKANDMDKLIGDLTVFSKIDTNKLPYHFVKLNVAEYFDDCIDEISIELDNKGFELNYHNYTDSSVEVVADPEQIKRVINNIISNSIKYNNKDKGVINIIIRNQKDFVHFEIKDNGKGVSSEELPYIFERFYRADTSRNTKTGGSGIGLSIVKKIIDAHGGTIWANSTVNEGLSVHFILKKADISEDYSEYKVNKEDKENGKQKNTGNRGRRKYRRIRKRLSGNGRLQSRDSK